jgi:hypothetical protein
MADQFWKRPSKGNPYQIDGVRFYGQPRDYHPSRIGIYGDNIWDT